MKKTDLLERRLRFAPPNPVVSRLQLTDRDFAIFEAINRHGPLPAHYLFELTRHLGKSYKHLQYRLTELYNGDSVGTYLTRPSQQFAGFEARYQHLVYDLTDRAKIALSEHGTLSNFGPRRTDPFLHQLMGACVGASIELGAKGKGIRYIPRAEIFAHPRAGKSLQAKNPMAIPLTAPSGSKTLIPDDLFGLEYPGGGFRFFAVEIDRNTESIERKNLDYNTFGKKITGYLELLRTKGFSDWWGIPNLSVLTVTTNATHAVNLLEYVQKQNNQHHAGRFAFACEPSFGVNWRVPKAVLSALLTDPWTTVSGPKDISQP